MSFALPGCRSNFSLLWGTASPEQLVERAAAAGIEHLGLADGSNLYGAIDFYHLCRRAGINPLLGVHLTTSCGPLHLIAKEHRGYQNLCRLVTRYHLEGSVDEAALAASAQDIACLAPAASQLENLRAIFGANLWLAITGDEERGVLQAATDSHIPIVADPSISFLDADDYPLHLLLRAIDSGSLIDNLEGVSHDGPGAFFPNQATMARRYRQYPEAVANAICLAEQCRVVFPEKKHVLPAYPGDQADKREKLRSRASDGLRTKRGIISGAYQSRLDFELAVIEKTGFIDYFLIVAGIVRHCQGRDIPVVGRGSAAGSLVAYGLGITQVDPIELGLYFERFLNEARSDPPDIDLDIDWRRRDDVLTYIYDTFGHDRTAMIATYTRFHARLAFREAAKATGLPPDDIDRLARRLPYGAGPDKIDNALQQLPAQVRAQLDIEKFRPAILAAAHLDNFPRHLGIHPGGIVITPTPLTDYVALERASKGIVVTQCDMYQAEQLGLVKIDVLGQRGQAVIIDCLNQVKASAGDDFAVPDNDPATYRLLQSGKTIGVFQIESPGLRSVLRDLHPRRLDDITLALALIRPGASDSGMKKIFLERHHGTAATTYLDPRLEKILKETFGVFIYQEQVLLCARDIAGFNLPAADLLRRAITKARFDTDYATLQKRFLSGAMKHGLSCEKATEIFKLLRCFAGFGFCKAHAATYGYLAYQSAYFKAHYPAFFMQAVLNNGGGYYPASVYIAEARRLGVKIRPPDVNESESDDRLEEGVLFVGLGRVRDLEQKTIEQILAGRPFASFDDFLSRVRLSAIEAEHLVKIGAFDAIEPNRSHLLWRLRLAARHGPVGVSEAEGPPAADIFSGQLIVPTASRLPNLPPVTPWEQFQYEQEILGFPATRHPLEIFPAYDPTPAAVHLEKESGAAITLSGWVVDIKRIKTREKKESMVFLTCEDLQDTFEIVLFPAVYKEYSELIRQYRFMRVEGKINREGGTVAIIADTLSPAPTGLAELPYL